MWLKSRPCLVCGRVPSDNAHIKDPDDPLPVGVGRKNSYRWTVPLCRTHHLELDSMDQAAFEKQHRLNLAMEAAALQCEWLELGDDYDLAS